MPRGFLHRVWPAREQHLRSVRAVVHGWLAPLGLDEDTEHNIVMTVSEAATNAIEHAYAATTEDGTVELTLWTESGHLCIEVVDHGTWREPPIDNRGRGFGLVMMHCLVADLLVNHSSRGTCVQLRHPLPDRSSALGPARQQYRAALDDDQAASPDSGGSMS